MRLFFGLIFGIICFRFGSHTIKNISRQLFSAFPAKSIFLPTFDEDTLITHVGILIRVLTIENNIVNNDIDDQTTKPSV